MKRISAFSLLCFFVLITNAEALITGIPCGDGNRFPFGTDEVFRYQQVYRSDLFAGPVAIRAIRFFLDDPGNLAAGTFEIYLSTTSQDVGNLDNVNLDNNVGADNQLFVSTTLTGGPSPAVLSFTGATFNYDPIAGNLLMDVMISGAVVSGTGATFQVDNCSSIFSRAYDFQGQLDTDAIGLVTEIVPIPAPGAALLAGIGLGLFGWLRRCERL